MPLPTTITALAPEKTAGRSARRASTVGASTCPTLPRPINLAACSILSNITPRLTPMRNRSRRSSGRSGSRSINPRWTSTAQRTASTTLGNSASRPSPVFFTMRPWCSVIFGSTSSPRCAFSLSCVPSSSAPISREYPATSAARMAARRRVEAMAGAGPLVESSVPLTVAQLARHEMRPTSRLSQHRRLVEHGWTKRRINLMVIETLENDHGHQEIGGKRMPFPLLQLGQPYRSSFRSLLTLHDANYHALAFAEVYDASPLEHGGVDENILPAAIPNDEAEPLGCVVPLHGTRFLHTPLRTRLVVRGRKTRSRRLARDRRAAVHV